MSETIPQLEIDKSTWGDGPWQSEPDRVNFVHAGLSCLALRHPHRGNWCGYIAVPREHPYYGRNPLEEGFTIDVHGELNYGRACEGYICHAPAPGMPGDVWWLGWDFNHAFDLAPASDALFRELIEKSGRKYEGFNFPMEVYRNLAYVRHDIERGAEQLAAMLPHP